MMRSEDPSRSIVSNGYSSAIHTPKKAANPVNGHSPAVNGSGPMKNGTSKSRRTRSPSYRGHNRKELTRILIQGLKDMGYENAASALSSESGYEVESSEVAQFRTAILSGRWAEAERILSGSREDEGGGRSQSPDHGLVLAEDADIRQMKFWIRQQKFLELLVTRNLLAALKVLRDELTPLGRDTYQLHTLASLLMCTQSELETQLRWPSDSRESRQHLLEDLTRSIAPSAMIRDHRLAELLDQVKRSQIVQCLYHNTSEAPSLYSDHTCSQDDFPSQASLILDDHSGEVYCVAFSPDGTMLATAGEDKSCIIYETVNFSIIQVLKKHNTSMTHLAWSPDSEKILTTAYESHAYVWEISTGEVMMSIAHNNAEQKIITSGAWMPDSTALVTCAHDYIAKMCYWDLQARNPNNPVYTWPRNSDRQKFRVADVAITPDGRRLLCNDMQRMLVIYDIQSRQEEFRINFSSKISCITPSKDNRTVLINIAEGEVHMIDIEERYTIRKFKGPSYDGHIIRNCFGGANENFVLSGSKDGTVSIWHKENGQLIETLKGHSKGQKGDLCVTGVSWSPVNPGIFASGGDDRKVMIWMSPSVLSQRQAFDPKGAHPDLNRQSAIRSTSNL